jgi:hypothetical protein
MAWCPPRQWLPLLSQKQKELIPPLRARTREEKRKDCKRILSVGNNTVIWRFNKAANSYLEDLTTCAFRLRTTRRPCGTEGRVSVNSTAGPGELSLLASPSVSFSARGFHLSYSSPLGFGYGAGEEVVRSRDAGLWRVTPVQLYVPLQKVFS